jgi:hypothetical protein
VSGRFGPPPSRTSCKPGKNLAAAVSGLWPRLQLTGWPSGFPGHECQQMSHRQAPPPPDNLTTQQQPGTVLLARAQETLQSLLLGGAVIVGSHGGPPPPPQQSAGTVVRASEAVPPGYSFPGRVTTTSGLPAAVCWLTGVTVVAREPEPARPFPGAMTARTGPAQPLTPQQLAVRTRIAAGEPPPPELLAGRATTARIVGEEALRTEFALRWKSPRRLRIKLDPNVWAFDFHPTVCSME